MIELPSARWLAVALFLLAAAILLHRTEPYLPSRRVRRIVERFVRPPVELLAAVTMAGWLLGRLVDGRTGWTGVIWVLAALAVAWTGRTALEDFVAGAVLRMEGGLERGRRLVAAGVAGRIERLGYRSVAIEAEDGSTVRLPWRALAREPLRLGDAGPSVRAHSFTLRVPRTRPIERVLEDIPAAAMLSPWASTTRLPEVRLQAESADGFVLEVTTHALDSRFAPQIEAVIRERLGLGG